ncbi:MAG TPA: GspE/PulE family protein [Candidatus Paceibacterota bacterium]|nr:GspE/PulE family protein [Candidatus Paceibacterota bacterium]HMP19048.1 GspE/PulE family protein [Candidatus Paceibacterota bacterium]HMP85187.1 GspE/PulE family protein [Candidatus Paceibacterota bacterium]
MFIDENKLKDFMIDSGIVTRDVWEDAYKKISKDHKQTIGDYLVGEGVVSEDELKRVQAYILGIPFIDIGSQKISFDVLNLIPEPIARKNNIVAYNKEGNKLEVAMLDTDNLSAIEFITKKTGLKILPRLTSSEGLKKAILQYQKSLKEDFGDIIKKEASNLDQSKLQNVGDLQKIATDLPVIKIVDTLLKHAIIQGASDIHIEPNEANVIVRYRVDGLLHDAMVLPKHSGPAIVARIKVLSSLKIDEKRLPQDGRFKTELEGENVSFRVSILPISHGEKIVMRILREGGGGFTLEALGFHGDGLEMVHSALKQTTGMILTTGPTGSGKTTTLYTLIDLLNTPDVNISTIEDPIEYQMPRVNQTQVKPDIGFTFSSGLRALVRQDPDIIMVGEIRDGETANLAINASLTGHLVLSTLHTNSASGTIPRLIDMGSQSFLLVSTLKVIIAQRLVRKLDKKEKYFLKKIGIEQLNKIANLDLIHRVLVDEKIIKPNVPWTEIPFYKPIVEGDDDGYSGRIGIQEILRVSDSVKDLILKNESAEKIEKQARAEGMLTMVEDGIYKSVLGVTTIEEVLRVVSE